MTAVHPAWTFYLVVECPQCDAHTYQGVCMTTMTHNGLPAIPVDMGTENSYDCSECGALICVNAVEVWAEDDDQ